MKFTIDGKDVKELNYSDIERKKFTTSLNIEYLNEFRNLCNYLDVNLNDTLKTEDEMIDCISVQASWQYELSSSVEIEQFQSEATFILTESEDHLVLNAILSE